MPHKYIFLEEHIDKDIIDANPNIDLEDFILIQMFESVYTSLSFSEEEAIIFPYLSKFKFIDLDSPDTFLQENEFVNNQGLIFSGFPFKENDFIYTDSSDFEDYSTNHFKRHVLGTYKENIHNKNEFGYFQALDIMGESSFSSVDMKGMSGGIITNLDLDSKKVKWAGMATTAGNKKVRFIPAYLIVNCLKRNH